MSSNKVPLMQRLGTAYIRRREAALPEAQLDDEVHILNAREQADLVKIQRAMIGRALVAGALSGLAAASAELLAAPLQRVGGLSDNVAYWAVVGGVTVAATLFEVGFLYWDSLRSVHDLARAAGVRLLAAGDIGPGSALATTLARAALEMPNPPDNQYGVDPHREVSKLRLVVASLAYKAKITVTSFLLKALLRRALGRAALRVWLVFVGVPVCAAWNAIVAWLVVRQARLRAIGPSAASVYVGDIFGTRDQAGAVPRQAVQLAPHEAAALWGAVGSCVVRSHEVHPNHLALLRELERHVPRPDGVDINDSAAFIESMAELDERVRTKALSLLAVAAILDGRIARDERRLLTEAYATAGRALSLKRVGQLRRLFAAGRPVSRELLDAVAGADVAGA